MTPTTDDGIHFDIQRVVTSVTRFHNQTDLANLLTKLHLLKTTGTIRIHLSQGGLNAIELEEKADAGTAEQIQFRRIKPLRP